MVWRLLRRNISPGQLIGYGLASFVGLSIVLTAIQFYRDVDSAWNGEDSFISEDYLIISKKVEGMGGSAKATEFSKQEIADIKSQPWVKNVGEFTAAAFNVSAAMQMSGRKMSTYLFLEAIPNEFFDVSPRGWDYEPGSGQEVPIVMSKDYLALYNFGFASSRGMPQLSESMIGLVPLQLSLSGNGKQQWVPARIVGFSSRLNTIAVPEEFLTWANKEYAEDSVPPPQRLIVSTMKPGDPQAKKYFDEHGIEIAGDKDNSGKAAFFLSVITSVVIVVGAIISILAFFILLLSIYLLLQKNREKIHDLMQLGYSPGKVAKYYYIIVGMVNLIVLIGSFGVVIFGSVGWKEPLEELGARSSSVLPALAIGLGIMVVITCLNFLAIKSKVSSAFR